jgi:SnoaL-like protein
MSSVARETIIKNVEDYVAAWNEPDAAARTKLLDSCWAEDATYLDPNADLRGRSALGAHITKMQAGRPGARIEFMSGIDLHHNVVRFLWRLVRGDGSTGDVSIDFGEVDASGKLVRIVGFFGEPPKR